MASNGLIDIQNKINGHKTNLAQNLTEKNVAAESNETLAALIEKVKNIETGGSSLDWSTLKDCAYLFDSENKLLTLFPTINSDMSQVTDWSYAFQDAIRSDEAQECFNSKYNILKFTYFSQDMFNDCLYLNKLNYNTELNAGPRSSMDRCFYNCVNLPIETVLDILSKIKDSYYTFTEGACAVGQNTASAGTVDLGDITLSANNLYSAFSSCHQIGTIGDIYLTYYDEYNQSGVSFDKLFYNNNFLKSIGTIHCKAVSSIIENGVMSSSNAIKAGGLIIENTRNSDLITSSFGKLYSSTKKIEELTNIPISYFRYGGKNITTTLNGSSSAARPLRKLTFSTTNIPYVSNNYNKELNISYCSFNKEGMIEMFNSLPDATAVTKTKTINIASNPCVTDSSLTDDDIAIATSKGYSVIKE